MSGKKRFARGWNSQRTKCGLNLSRRMLRITESSPLSAPFLLTGDEQSAKTDCFNPSFPPYFSLLRQTSFSTLEN